MISVAPLIHHNLGNKQFLGPREPLVLLLIDPHEKKRAKKHKKNLHHLYTGKYAL